MGREGVHLINKGAHLYLIKGSANQFEAMPPGNINLIGCSTIT